MKLWGERLKMLRLEHGMTQQALADKLCTERTTIAGWELKGKEPDFQLVVDIADVFNVSVDYLSEMHFWKNPKKCQIPMIDDTSPYESD